VLKSKATDSNFSSYNSGISTSKLLNIFKNINLRVVFTAI
jgi:hypothetical protein